MDGRGAEFQVGSSEIVPHTPPYAPVVLSRCYALASGHYRYRPSVHPTSNLTSPHPSGLSLAAGDCHGCRVRQPVRGYIGGGARRSHGQCGVVLYMTSLRWLGIAHLLPFRAPRPCIPSASTIHVCSTRVPRTPLLVCRRMYPLTEQMPKALLPVANVPLIGYVMKALEVAKFDGATQCHSLPGPVHAAAVRCCCTAPRRRAAAVALGSP